MESFLSSNNQPHLRIHNSFLLASAWNIVSRFLDGLAVDGLTDNNVKMKLKTNTDMRDRYLVIYDMVERLVSMSQSRFAVLATSTRTSNLSFRYMAFLFVSLAHYAKYFKLKPSEGANSSESGYVFDWSDLRKAASSFLDSIIIEMCFPRGTYPMYILLKILHDAVEEAPRETHRFPQELWDAVGDLSVGYRFLCKYTAF